MHWFHLALGVFLLIAVLVSSQNVTLSILPISSQLTVNLTLPILPCLLIGCGSSPDRCGPDQHLQSCNATSGHCYCPEYKCDNLLKNCSSMVCPLTQRPECVFDEYGTSCKCVALIDNCISYSCRLPQINRAEIERYNDICGQLGGSYFATKCAGDDDNQFCRCRTKWCRSNADCPCPNGGVSTCFPQTNRCSPCECSSNADCQWRCNAGQISVCQYSTRLYKECSNCVKNCTSNSDCSDLACPLDKPIKRCQYSLLFNNPGCHCDRRRCGDSYGGAECPSCPAGQEKTCYPGNICGCITRGSCTQNDDCNRSNGLGCSFPNLSPSCCWGGCGREKVCRCQLGGGILSCNNGDNGMVLYPECS